jgi:hypothetical protein
MTAARSGPFPLVRAAYGVALLCAPGTAIRLCTGQAAGSRARAVTRLLGARHLVQAALTAGMPNAVMLAVGAQIDLVHSASMLALAAADPPLRRAGLADGITAATFAAVGTVGARTWRQRVPVSV